MVYNAILCSRLSIPPAFTEHKTGGLICICDSVV